MEILPEKSRNIATNKMLPVYIEPPQEVEKGGRIGWWEEGEDGVLGKQRLDTLRKSWLAGFFNEMACSLAGISLQQLFYYCKINPAFAQEMKQLKMNVPVNAHFTISKGVETDAGLAWRYLAKKFPNEFGETPPGVINNFGVMNTQINEEYFEVPDNVDELLDGEEIK